MNVGSNAQERSCRIKKPRSSASLAQSRAAIRSSLIDAERRHRAVSVPPLTARGKCVARFLLNQGDLSCLGVARLIKLATKAAILFGALFLVSVLNRCDSGPSTKSSSKLSLLPNNSHPRMPRAQAQTSAQTSSQDSSLTSSQSADHSAMAGMSMDEKASERAAFQRT